MLSRTRSSFTLSATVIFCVSAIIAIAPFAIIRALDGDWVIALIDMGIIVGLLAILISCYYTKKVKHGSVLITGFYTIAAILVIHVDFFATVYWLYPIFIANFFLLRIWPAAFMNGLALIVVATFYTKFESNLEFLSVIATMALVNVFAGLFSWKVQKQRRSLRDKASTLLSAKVKTRNELVSALTELPSSKNALKQEPNSLIMLEVDQLKEISDNFGYEISDTVLGNVAGSLSGRLRAETDIIYRYTSRKLIIVLQSTSVLEAVKVAESIRLQITDSIQGPEGDISVTLACTELNTLEEWTSSVDRLEMILRKAQSNGGNTVFSSLPLNESTEQLST